MKHMMDAIAMRMSQQDPPNKSGRVINKSELKTEDRIPQSRA